MTRLLVCVATLVCIMDKAWCYGTWSFEQRLAARFGASAKFDITVVDDEGAVVPDAKVSVGFGQQGNKRLGEVVSIMTDEKGLSEAEGRTTGDNLWIKVEKEGYYSFKTNFNYIAAENRHEVRINRWQPYGEKISVLLRKKHNPVLCKRQRGAGDYAMPVLNQWLEFDLEKGDWITPLGLGERTDIKVKICSDGKPSWQNRYISMEMEFVNEHDGCYFEETIPTSELQYPYYANVKESFITRKIFASRERKGGHLNEVTPFIGRSMVARIRTELNDKGEVVNCMYANIRFVLMEADSEGNPIFTIDYRLNLTPNDPNLETL